MQARFLTQPCRRLIKGLLYYIRWGLQLYENLHSDFFDVKYGQRRQELPVSIRKHFPNDDITLKETADFLLDVKVSNIVKFWLKIREIPVMSQLEDGFRLPRFTQSWNFLTDGVSTSANLAHHTRTLSDTYCWNLIEDQPRCQMY